jgi:GTPase Era involved in 16S rRNA processing
VVGEFSQGKSTLLNALLGEEIQPVRAIPCSGTVTVLKYGTHKRVVCCYKDKRTEDISLDQYQVKAAISEEAALGSLSEELVQSEIEEIVFEHPDLDLCRSGVEIVDSPGLNEHPDRTAITQQLLKGTDAVIFLANASRPLTQGERDLLQNLKVQLNCGKVDEPAENIFVAVNFMDLLRREKDRQDVRQRIERFVQGENIITGENRVHFISAQAALDAILEGTQDEYLKAFQSFSQSIEKFLTVDRGSLEIKQAVTRINDLIQEGLDGLQQAEKILDGKISLSEAEKQKILENIGEASGRDVRIRLAADQLVDEIFEPINESWNIWIEGLPDRLWQKVEHWSSEHSAIWSREQLVKDYIEQFNQDLSTELDNWIDNQLKEKILKQYMERIDFLIKQELTAIEQDFNETSSKFYFHQKSWILMDNKSGIADELGVAGQVSLAGLSALLIVPTFIFFSSIFAFVVAIIGSGVLGFNLVDMFEFKNKVKAKVFEVGFEKFVESIEDVHEKINNIVFSGFQEKVKVSEQVIYKAITFYEQLLEQQEKAHNKTIEQRDAEKAWISQKRQELEQVQKNIEAILPS